MDIDVTEHYDKIYRYCFLRVRERETAEDITQETFLRFIQQPSYHSTDKALRILYTIAKNLCTDHFRKPPPQALDDNIPANDNIEDNVIDNLTLRQALFELSDEDREIVLLRYINDVPVGVISSIYGISRFALNRRLKRILTQLKSSFGKE